LISLPELYSVITITQNIRMRNMNEGRITIFNPPSFQKPPGPRPGKGIARKGEGETMKSKTQLYKVVITSPDGSREQRRLAAPKDAEGYYRREVSPDGMTITYRKVA
jgi:hypothetical protein